MIVPLVICSHADLFPWRMNAIEQEQKKFYVGLWLSVRNSVGDFWA